MLPSPATITPASTMPFPMAGRSLPSAPLMKNFGLDVTDYVAVNFDSLAEVIDAMGGVEVDVTEAERLQINAYLLSGEPFTKQAISP